MCLLVGAGDEADLFMRAVSANPQSPFHVVGIVGENDKRVGRSIHGVDVLGTVAELPELVAEIRARGKAPSRLVLTRASHALQRRAGRAIARSISGAGPQPFAPACARPNCATTSPRRWPCATSRLCWKICWAVRKPNSTAMKSQTRQRAARTGDRRGRHDRR